MNALRQEFRYPFQILLAALLLTLPLSISAEAKEGILGNIDSFMTEGSFADFKARMQKDYGLTIQPYFKSGFELTENVFKSPEPDRQDVLWTFAPGINLVQTNPYGELGLSYEARFRYFTRHGDQNEQDQSFSVYADLYPTEAVNVKISEEIVQQGGTAGAVGLEPLNNLDNTVRVNIIVYPEKKISGEVGYKNFSREYAGKIFEQFGYIENEYLVEGFLEVNEKTNASAGYHIGTLDYDKGGIRNAVYHKFPVGLNGVLPGEIHYQGTVAVYVKDQENTDRNDFWAFIGSLDLKKQITEKTAVGLGFFRRPVESTYDGADLADDKTFYANLTHRLTDKARARLDLSWSNQDFETRATLGPVTAKRDDDVFSLGLGLDYAYRKWMVFNIDYRIERRNSNFSSFDYTENRFGIGVTIPV